LLGARDREFSFGERVVMEGVVGCVTVSSWCGGAVVMGWVEGPARVGGWLGAWFARTWPGSGLVLSAAGRRAW
jgi:hypothetical protein